MRMKATGKRPFQALTILAILVFACSGATAEQLNPADHWPNVDYTLMTGLDEGRMAFIGIGGEIDGLTNPRLKAVTGDIVLLIIVNGRGDEHGFAIAGLDVKAARLAGKGSAEAIAFRVTESGTFEYACTDHGHRQAGMQGLIVVSDPE